MSFFGQGATRSFIHILEIFDYFHKYVLESEQTTFKIYHSLNLALLQPAGTSNDLHPRGFEKWAIPGVSRHQQIVLQPKCDFHVG